HSFGRRNIGEFNEGSECRVLVLPLDGRENFRPCVARRALHSGASVFAAPHARARGKGNHEAGGEGKLHDPFLCDWIVWQKPKTGDRCMDSRVCQYLTLCPRTSAAAVSLALASFEGAEDLLCGLQVE